MTRARKRPHGLRLRRAPPRAPPLRGVRRRRTRGRRPELRAQDEDDAPFQWSRLDLIEMDRAFCAAMGRAIARGSERPRAPAHPPPPRQTARAIGSDE
jgi:hypothetical protein